MTLSRFNLTIAGAALLLVGAALALLFLLPQDDARAVEALLRRAVENAEQGDADAVVALVSSHFEPASDREAAIRRIREEIHPGRPQTCEIKALAVDASEGEAHATLRINVRILKHEVGDVALRLRLKKETCGWKVVSGEEIP